MNKDFAPVKLFMSTDAKSCYTCRSCVLQAECLSLIWWWRCLCLSNRYLVCRYISCFFWSWWKQGSHCNRQEGTTFWGRWWNLLETAWATAACFWPGNFCDKFYSSLGNSLFSGNTSCHSHGLTVKNDRLTQPKDMLLSSVKIALNQEKVGYQQAFNSVSVWKRLVTHFQHLSNNCTVHIYYLHTVPPVMLMWA